MSGNDLMTITVLVICLLSELALGVCIGMNLKMRREVKEIMSELGDALNAISVQLAKAKDEILAKISALEGQIGTIPADAQANLDAVKAIAQALDDVVPDVPA
jgi:hypothetical protein